MNTLEAMALLHSIFFRFRTKWNALISKQALNASLNITELSWLTRKSAYWRGKQGSAT